MLPEMEIRLFSQCIPAGLRPAYKRKKETAQFPIPQKELRGSSEEVPATAINTLQRFR